MSQLLSGNMALHSYRCKIFFFPPCCCCLLSSQLIIAGQINSKVFLMISATQVAVKTAEDYQCFYDLIIALLDLTKVAKWACLQQGISDNGADSSLTPHVGQIGNAYPVIRFYCPNPLNSGADGAKWRKGDALALLWVSTSTRGATWCVTRKDSLMKRPRFWSWAEMSLWPLASASAWLLDVVP